MKVNILDKKLWQSFFPYTSGVLVIYTILSFFINDNKYKETCGEVIIAILACIFFYMLYKANFINKIKLKINLIEVEIFYGDLFDQKGLKLIPFNEYFDTIVDNEIISENSLNGVFIDKHYQNNIGTLNSLICKKLDKTSFKENPSRIKGKTKKYKLGTTIEIEKNYILTALTHFNDNNEASLSTIEYLHFLNILCKQISVIYSNRIINIPLIGSGISRIGNNLKYEDYLFQIINSLNLSEFSQSSRAKINIVLHKDSKKEVNLYKMKSIF